LLEARERGARQVNWVPTYEEAANLNVGDELIAEVWRDGRLVPLAIALGGRSIVVPQWRLSGD
jgi:hypothetical protein